MFSSLEALDDPLEQTSVPRVSAFQPKAKPRGRKPNNASNTSAKTKNKDVDKKPSKQQFAKVDLSETKADEEDNSVGPSASPCQDTVGSLLIVPSTPAENPVEGTLVLDVGTQLCTHSTVSDPAGENLVSVQEPVSVSDSIPSVQEPAGTDRILISSSVPSVSDPVDEIPVSVATIPEPLNTIPSSPVVEEAPVSVTSELDPLIRQATPQLSSLAEKVIEEVPVNENPQGEEPLLSLAKASLEQSSQNSDESRSGDDTYNASCLSPLSNPVVCKTSSVTEDDKRQTDVRRSRRKVPMPLRFTTEVGETREDALETKGLQSSNKWRKVKDQQSQNGISDPKGRPKNKKESRRVTQDLRVGQKISKNGENCVENLAENGTEKITNLDDLSKISICSTENISVREPVNDCTILQQEIVENSENVSVSYTKILPEEAIAPMSCQDEENNHPHRNWRKRLKAAHATDESAAVQNDMLEDRGNVRIENTERQPGKEATPEDSSYDKNNKKSRFSRKQARKVADGTAVAQQEILDLNILEGVATGNDLDEQNSKSKWSGQKMRGSKAAYNIMKDSEEILEDRENSYVPNTETLSAEGVIPLNNLGGKTSSQSRCRKRKTMTSTKLSECGDSNRGAGDVGKPLKDQELNENVKDKKTQTKKRTSKSGKSLEAAKKRFSRSTTRHCRRVEKHLLDIPEGDLDYSKLAMKDLIRLAEAKEKELNKQKATNKKSCLSEAALNSNANEPGKESQEDEGVVLAPQVQVINGQIVINEESLVVSHRELNVNDIHTYRRVEETSSKLNYHTYMNRTPLERWSKSDTELFYKAMQQFGTDFGMIQHFFPGRTRRQVKAKFKIEERKHPLQLANALIHRPQDHSHFEMLIDRLKISSAPVEHDNNDHNKFESLNLNNVPIEDSHDAHERRETVTNQMNSTIDSPKTHENEQNEEMQVTEQHSGLYNDNYVDLSKNNGENPSSTMRTHSSMEESNACKEASPSPENASDEPIRKPAKSPFAYQLASSKPVKSLFSYQLT